MVIGVFFFSVNASFSEGFQRNVDDSIQMPDISWRNSNVHFILGNIMRDVD